MNAKRIFTAISLIISILSIAVPTYFSIEQSKEKSLSIIEKSRQAFFEKSVNAPTELSLQLNGRPVKTPWALTLSYENSGRIPVLRNEIESPIEIKFRNSNIIDAQIINKSPSNIAATIIKTQKSIQIAQGLLNPGDKIQISILLDGASETPTIDGRVSDVPTISYVKYNPDIRNQDIIPKSIIKTAQIISALLLLLVALALTSEFTKKIRIKKEKFNGKSFNKISLIPLANIKEEIIEKINSSKMSPLSLIILNYAKEHVTIDWLDNGAHFMEMLNRIKFPDEIQNKDAFTDATSELYENLVQSLKNYAAQNAFLELPVGPDEAVRDNILGVDISQLGAINFINAVDKHTEETIKRHYIENPEPLITRQELVLFTITFIAFASFCLVIADSYFKS